MELEVYNFHSDGYMCDLIHAHFDKHNLFDNKAHFTSTVHKESNTALIRAIKNARVEIATLLLDRGAKIDIAEKVRCNISI
jgi:ankyrin repeat protein